MSTNRVPKPLLLALMWGLVGCALCASIIGLEPNMLEEGLILHVAQRMLRGEHLFRDIVSFTGPLPFDALTLLFRVFGEEIVVARGAIAVLWGLSCAATYDLARRSDAGPLAHAAAACIASAPILLFPLLSVYFYTTIAIVLCPIAGYAALRGLGSSSWALSAGLLIAGVALCKQTLGVLLAISLFATVAACAERGSRGRRLGEMAAGGAIATALTLGGAALRGDVGIMLHSLVILPLSFTDTFDSAYMNFWPLGSFSNELYPDRFMYLPFIYTLGRTVFDEVAPPMVLFTQLLYALPLLAIGGTAIARSRHPLPNACWIHFAVLIAVSSNLFPRTDWGHLQFVLPCATAHLMLLVPRSSDGSATPLRVAAATALVALLGVTDAATARMLHSESTPSRMGERVPQRAVSSLYKGPGVPSVVGFLLNKAEPGEAIFVARSEPLIYFATNTTNPTAYSGVVPGMRQQQQRDILAGLEAVRFVVMSDIDQPVYTYYRDELPAVQAYFERHFRLPLVFSGKRNQSWIVVLERGPDRGPTAIDLFERAATARAWIRDAEGGIRPSSDPVPVLGTRRNRRPTPFLLGPRGGGIDFELDLPADARFQGDVGFRHMLGTSARYTHHDGGLMVVSVRTRENRHFERVGAVRIPFGRGASYGWLPVDLDLAQYAGERVTLRLHMLPDGVIEADRMAWWGSPRIAVSPPPPQAAQSQEAP